MNLEKVQMPYMFEKYVLFLFPVDFVSFFFMVRWYLSNSLMDCTFWFIFSKYALFLFSIFVLLAIYIWDRSFFSLLEMYFSFSRALTWLKNEFGRTRSKLEAYAQVLANEDFLFSTLAIYALITLILKNFKFSSFSLGYF